MIAELSEYIIAHEKAPRENPIDIYGWYDPATCSGRLELFENPGGNSWIEGSYTICRLSPMEGLPEFSEIFCGSWNLDDFAEVLGVSEDRLQSEVSAEFDSCDWVYIVRFISENESYHEIFHHYFCDWIDENSEDYTEAAAQYISRWEAILNE